MNLRDYLSSTKKSRAHFAKAIGVDVVTVGRYITGRRRPDWPVLAKIVAETHGAVTANDFIVQSVARPIRRAPKRRGNGASRGASQ